MRQSRMGLIQTVDQLKFSYMAIAEGARQAELISSDSPALSAILPSKTRGLGSTTTYTRALDSSSSSDSSSDFDYGLGPPPLPPPRSESLLASNSNMSTEQRLQNQQVYVNGNDNGPGLLLPADIAKDLQQIEAYNDMPQNLTTVYGHTDSASLSEPNQNIETNIINNEIKDNSISGSLHPEGPTVSASPTKQYILNNHKLEERKRYVKCLKYVIDIS